MAIPWKEHTNSFLSNGNWSTLKTHIQVTLYGLNHVYIRICMYVQITICIQSQLMKREAMNLKDSREGFKAGFKGRKGKGEML